ncbi:MAG: hypothetical protein V1767_07445 [Chloroflexota bacterium]
MKNLAYLVMAFLLGVVMLTSSCTSAPTTPATSDRGWVESVDTAKDTITITTESGKTQTIKVTPQTQILLEGRACTLEELAAAVDPDVQLECVIISEGSQATIIDVAESPPTETGTVESIGPKSITITTASGVDETYTVTPQTELTIGGRVCTLAEAEALAAAGDATCTVVVSETDPNVAVSIEFTPPKGYSGEPGPGTVERGKITAVTPGSVTITSVGGDTKTFEITPDTEITLEGKACPINQLDSLFDTNSNIICTVVTVEGQADEALSIDVYYKK